MSFCGDARAVHTLNPEMENPDCSESSDALMIFYDLGIKKKKKSFVLQFKMGNIVSEKHLYLLNGIWYYGQIRVTVKPNTRGPN